MEKEEFNLTTPMVDFSKDILRQRNKIEDDSRQMSDDIIYFIKCYFERTKNNTYKFEKPYVAQGFDTPIIAIRYDKDINGIFIVFAETKATNAVATLISVLTPIEQAKLFEYFVSEINTKSVYVVMEEIFDEMPSSEVLAVFKDLEQAQEYIVKRRKQQAFEKQYIWERARAERMFSNPQAFADTKNRYFLSTSEYIYDIRIICQEVL